MKITKRELRRLLGEARRGLTQLRGATNCLYILYGGMGVYYYVAQGGLSEDEAAAVGQDVTAVLAGDEGMADPLSLYDWLQNHDDIEYVFDDESVGGFAAKGEFMMQLRDVGEEEGLFAPEDEINESDPLREAKTKKATKGVETQKARPDGYTDLPAFMTHGRQSPTKYSGYSAQLGAGVIDDPAVADPEGDNIDADALRVVRQLQATGAGQKEDKKKIKEGSMSVTRKEIRRLVNEALDEMGNAQFGKRGSRDDSFMDYDPEEIPDMDDQYDPEYYEDLDDEEDDSFMDYETGDDDVPYGAADVALRMGRGYRTDESSLNESIDMLSAGIGAIVGIAALYAAGPLSRVATNILNNLSDAQRSAAMDKAREKAGTEMAEAIENLSRDTKLVALFKELEAAQEDGTGREAREKSKEITAYISEKRKDMSFGRGDAQDVRRGVAKRLKKGDDDKGDDKLDEGRWAQLAGILKG